MSDTSKVLVVGAAVLAVVGAGFWAYRSADSIQPQVVLAARTEPAAAIVPHAVPEPAAARASEVHEDSPDNILLVSTSIEPGHEEATFLIDGRPHAFRQGEAVAGSVVKIRKITAGSVLMAMDGEERLHEVKIKTPKEIAARLNDAKAAAAAAPDYGGHPVAASDSVVLRNETGESLPPEMQVHMRRRVSQTPGPVGGE